MATSDPLPTLPERTSRDRRTGRLLLGAGFFNLVCLVVIAALAFTILQQSGVISALSGGLAQQRSQFEACKDKAASTRGCTTPVAAAPEVIVKQGGQGVAGIAGAVGPAGAEGPQGPAGPEGPAGKQGPVGKAGPPPGCSLLATACVGASGPEGPKGDTGDKGDTVVGPAGPEGPLGPKGDTGATGETGPGGAQGEEGRGIALFVCPADDNDPTTDQAWDISWTKAPLHTEGGVCRAKTAP